MRTYSFFVRLSWSFRFLPLQMSSPDGRPLPNPGLPDTTVFYERGGARRAALEDGGIHPQSPMSRRPAVLRTWRRIRVPLYAFLTVFFCSLQSVAFKRAGYSLQNYPILILLSVSFAFVPIFFGFVWAVECVWKRKYDVVSSPVPSPVMPASPRKVEEDDLHQQVDNLVSASELERQIVVGWRSSSHGGEDSATTSGHTSAATSPIASRALSAGSSGPAKAARRGKNDSVEDPLPPALKKLRRRGGSVLLAYCVIGVLGALNGLLTLFANPFVGGIEQSLLAQSNICCNKVIVFPMGRLHESWRGEERRGGFHDSWSRSMSGV